MFAIVDLETTGGNSNSERIIEIGIILHDGKQKIGEYTTLVNPEKEISAFISTFTGITNAMVKHAPKFEDIAHTVAELLENNVFVAHNARFDYHFLRSEFKRLNIPFSKKILCTVQYTRKVFPHKKSYSLGNICKELEIPIDNRHRAFGDALATAYLLEKAIANDKKDYLSDFLTDDIHKMYLPEKISIEQVAVLPEELGVIYFHNEQGEIVYIDKSKNIREYVINFFLKKPIEKNKIDLHRIIAGISYETSGSELVASLQEFHEKMQHKPRYNRPVSMQRMRFGLFAEDDAQGFQKLMVKLIEEAENPLLKFTSKFKADRMMHSILTSSRLEPAFKKIESSAVYNQRLQDVLAKFIYPHNSFFIIDEGRGGTEKSIVKIENNEYKGFGFIEQAYIASMEDLHDAVQFREEFHDAKKVIQSYLRKNGKYLNIIPF